MSYILDALRKSDQQRQRGAAPTLQTAQFSVAEPRSHANWIYALIAVLLVAAGIAIGWLHGGQLETGAANPLSGATVHERVSAAEPNIAGRPRNTAAAPAAPHVPVADSAQSREVPQEQIRNSALQSASAPASAGSVRPEASRGRADIRDMPEGTAATTNRQPIAGTGATSAAPEPGAMRIGELPKSIQQELPDMHVSLHLYSTRPANSFVDINNQMLQEGANVAPGLKLEKITPDGMEFSYKGYRFRRGVQ